MSRIVEFIADETNGKAYKSHKFCFDAELKLPSLSYEDPKEFTIEKQKLGETDDKLKTTKDLSNFAKQLSIEKPLFTYFLDGSRRIYKVDDIEYSQRLFPVVAGQVGVACCQRLSAGEFKKVNLKCFPVLALPSIAVTGQKHEKQYIGHLIDKINKLDKMKRFGVGIHDLLIYKSDLKDGEGDDYMDRGTAKIQDKMIECEKQIVDELAKKNFLNEDNYLIKDGTLQYGTATNSNFKELAVYKSNYRCVVGVSKSFNPEFSKNHKGKSNASAIAQLPLFHRTPAIRYYTSRIGDVHFCIWYVRIREKKYTDSPFSGILKLEKVLVSNDEIEYGLQSSEIDRITANIINERNPVCYGKDQRWANHLYPVYLTESYIKSQYLGDVHFLNLF
ncbi:hypothetical protein [Hymenobacter sp. YC55]|uniref:hypothetical protein n=1 Tax=Hymenobacter sp. YC55 TaxID=3034019 RepID=UPI0023F749F0|nr:hypothetical protein [Hymenobacter sp. YC55]MDF7812855.1 hypothetical protein [Hymenobacter sp. YC55]